MKKLINLLLLTACSTENQKDIPFRIVEPSYTEEAKPSSNPNNPVVSKVPTDIDLCFYPEGSFEITYIPVSSTCDETSLSKWPLIALQYETIQKDRLPLPTACLDAIEEPTVVSTKNRNTCEISISISCKLIEETQKFNTTLKMVNDTQVSGTYSISYASCAYTWEITGNQINPVLAE